MDEYELVHMLKDIESDLAERKASLSDPDRIRQAICAYANDLPDHRKPIFHLRPADGAIGSHLKGVQDARENFRQLAVEIARRCDVTL